MVQWVPSQCSANVAELWSLSRCNPTATQLLGLVHDTPASDPPARGGSGLAILAQLDPLPRTTRVCPPELSKNDPTAVQLVALVHETPDNKEFEFGGPGLAATDHPSDATLTPALVMMPMTATSAVAATRHDPRVTRRLLNLTPPRRYASVPWRGYRRVESDHAGRASPGKLWPE
jgi:hypothetical protein